MAPFDGPVLIVAAHPDDEVLGCGGTMGRLHLAGVPFHIAILAEGETSRYDRPEQADPDAVARLRRQAQEVADMLGAQSLVQFGLPDNRLDTVPLLDVIKRIEALIREVRPATVLTHAPGDLNRDHRICAEAVLVATRPAGDVAPAAVFGFYAASASEWAFDQFEPAFRPTLFVDIADHLDGKVAAMQHYEGEARAFPHPRSAEALRAQAAHCGAIAGLLAAEPYACVRERR